jgi:hypothetical protein
VHPHTHCVLYCHSLLLACRVLLRVFCNSSLGFREQDAMCSTAASFLSSVSRDVHTRDRTVPCYGFGSCPMVVLGRKEKLATIITAKYGDSVKWETWMAWHPLVPNRFLLVLGRSRGSVPTHTPLHLSKTNKQNKQTNRR